MEANPIKARGRADNRDNRSLAQLVPPEALFSSMSWLDPTESAKKVGKARAVGSVPAWLAHESSNGELGQGVTSGYSRRSTRVR
jgi:hypothetical protein